jgi:hypothetical protein
VAWAGAFGLCAFLFTHLLLRPGSGYVGRTADRSTITVEALFFFFAALSVIFWGYFRFRRQSALSSSGDARLPVP